MRNFLLNTYCNKNQNRQRPASKTMYTSGFYPSKLGLHPEMLPSLAYIIKLLKITIKTKTGLLMYVYFLLYIYLFNILRNWYFNTSLTSSMNLADLSFLFIMTVTTICSFWILECRVLARASNCHDNLDHFFKVDVLEKLYYICIFS